MQHEVTRRRETEQDTAIRPFRVQVPEESLVDLRRRLHQTRWPDRETVKDRSQGVQLASMQHLVDYWRTKYDWRKAEAKLNALPQFVTTIDGLDIHFIHVRSKHPNAMPLLITHGWPGSVFELLKVVEPLTNPQRPEDAFDLILPSIPGFGFSGRPPAAGWDLEHIARAWTELMKRLGYERWVAQGGDVGAFITGVLARQSPPGLLGIHLTLPAVVPDEVGAALAGGPMPQLVDEERAAFDAIATYGKHDSAYNMMMTTRPQTIGFALADTPAGLAAWLLGHPGFAKWSYGDSGSPTRDDVLDDITLYWLTNTGASAARVYWEGRALLPLSSSMMRTSEITIPVGISVFADEVFRAPETWARRAYRKLVHFNRVDKGGHFASWEQPQLFADEMRAAFRSLRAS
jgi:pimeloyl-ACP methyl ester carboxylesterase